MAQLIGGPADGLDYEIQSNKLIVPFVLGEGPYNEDTLEQGEPWPYEIIYHWVPKGDPMPYTEMDLLRPTIGKAEYIKKGDTLAHVGNYVDVWAHKNCKKCGTIGK